MYYQFTGQPGHGKTVLAIELALNMRDDHEKLQQKCRDKGEAVPPDRPLYVCNVRDFNHGAAGAIPLEPKELVRWHFDAENPESPTHINSAFENAIILVDEAYEHVMFPKRSPGSLVPEHVKRVAKHRHWGIDFIMVCQSPKKQMDDFLHDLIEEHYHVRRRFGLPLVHVKRWDKFEPYPDKALALTVTRRRYPTQIFKLYTSTKFDTSKRRVPWFYPAAAALLIAVLVGTFFTVGNIKEQFTSPAHKPVADKAQGTPHAKPANAGGAGGGTEQSPKWETLSDYAKSHLPRFASMPWTAPVFDQRGVTADPVLVCASSLPGEGGDGQWMEASCTCYTEQSTLYEISQPECRRIARRGPVYNPYLQRSEARAERGPEPQQAASAVPASGPVAVSMSSPQMMQYGGMAEPKPESAP